MSSTNIVVPDLGDFNDVEIIEILVAPGDISTCFSTSFGSCVSTTRTQPFSDGTS